MEINLADRPRRRRRPSPPHRLRMVSGPLRLLAHRYVRNLLVGTEVRLVRGEGGRPAVEGHGIVRETLRRYVPAQPGEERNLVREIGTLLRGAEGLLPVPVKGGPMARDVGAVMRAAGLGPVEGAVLQFLATIHLAKGLEPLTDLIAPLSHGGAVDVVAVATGLPRQQVAAAVDASGRLVGSGLLFLGIPAGTVDQKLSLDLRLRELLSEPGLTAARLRQAFVPRAAPPTLDLPDFSHVAATVDRAVRLLEAAARGREPGINLLLHGPTGSGKSELARLLAQRARLALHAVGTVAPGGFTPSPPERLGSLLLGQKLLGRGRAALLFDELEDLFEVSMARSGGRAPGRMSKAWFNDHLERNPVPTIWIINDPSVLDPAFLRRFSMSVALEPLDAARRQRVLERAGHGLPKEEESALAARYPVSAAELTNAVRVARLVGGGRVEGAVVEGLLDSSVRLLTGAPPPPPPAPARTRHYRPDLANATLDLDALAARLGGIAPDEGVTLCLHGPPGTGKSEYVRHLAERLGRPLVLRRVSDIESKYVGEAEKNLAAAFEEAARERAILLFDEADSFLRERVRATQRWEVTLTNEFLQRLEEARGVVACTTNLFEDLDPAVLRRFALRVRFDYLKPAQAEGLFQTTLAPLLPPGSPPTPRLPLDLERCGSLAPGDFAVVARRARLLGAPVTAAWLLGELAAEAAARASVRRPILGFRAGGEVMEEEGKVLRG